jgi:hypothetical protein
VPAAEAVKAAAAEAAEEPSAAIHNAALADTLPGAQFATALYARTAAGLYDAAAEAAAEAAAWALEVAGMNAEDFEELAEMDFFIDLEFQRAVLEADAAAGYTLPTDTGPRKRART